MFKIGVYFGLLEIATNAYQKDFALVIEQQKYLIIQALKLIQYLKLFDLLWQVLLKSTNECCACGLVFLQIRSHFNDYLYLYKGLL